MTLPDLNDLISPDLKPEVLIDGLIFPESPRWHNGKFFFSDMNDGMVFACDLQGNIRKIVDMPGPCSGIGWRPDGTMLIVSMHDRCLMAWNGTQLELVSDLYEMATYHCNDMVVDRVGRAYIGNFGFDLGNRKEIRPAEIIMVDVDGTASVAADNLLFPNGTVITPDHKTLIVGQTFGGCLTSFKISENGSLSAPRIWAELPGIYPDGICLDEAGAIWLACPNTANVLRVEKGGHITHVIPVKTNAYACMLGGPDRKTLFIATSGSTYRSGKIEIVRVPIPGTGLP